MINKKMVTIAIIIIAVIAIIIFSLFLPKLINPPQHDEKFLTISSLNSAEAERVRIMKYLYGDDYFDNQPSFYGDWDSYNANKYLF